MYAQLDSFVSHSAQLYDTYRFEQLVAHIEQFVNSRLSAQYLACVKERLYCLPARHPARDSVQAFLLDSACALCALLAPILPHMADECFLCIRDILARATPRDAQHNSLDAHTQQPNSTNSLDAQQANPPNSLDALTQNSEWLLREHYKALCSQDSICKTLWPSNMSTLRGISAQTVECVARIELATTLRQTLAGHLANSGERVTSERTEVTLCVTPDEHGAQIGGALEELNKDTRVVYGSVLSELLRCAAVFVHEQHGRGEGKAGEGIAVPVRVGRTGATVILRMHVRRTALSRCTRCRRFSIPAEHTPSNSNSNNSLCSTCKLVLPHFSA